MSQRLLAVLAVTGLGLVAAAQASVVTPEQEDETEWAVPAKLRPVDADEDGRIDSAAGYRRPETPGERFQRRTPDLEPEGALDHQEHIDAPTEAWRNRLGSHRLG